MTEFEKIVIGKSSIPSLIITVILMIAIPVGCFLHWHGKHKQQTKISYLIAGAIGFILSARVLELGVHYVCILADNPVSRFINGNTWAFVLYGTMMAGVFEECGRHIILKYILKKNRTRENAVLYGIGHGGIEILAVLLPTMILYLVIAILFSQGNVEEAMNIVHPDGVDSLTRTSVKENGILVRKDIEKVREFCRKAFTPKSRSFRALKKSTTESKSSR